MWKKAKLLKMSNLTFFHNVFYAICIYKSFIGIFQPSLTASLNLGRSQNDVLGNGLNFVPVIGRFFFLTWSFLNKDDSKSLRWFPPSHKYTNPLLPKHGRVQIQHPQKGMVHFEIKTIRPTTFSNNNPHITYRDNYMNTLICSNFAFRKREVIILTRTCSLRRSHYVILPEALACNCNEKLFYWRKGSIWHKCNTSIIHFICKWRLPFQNATWITA